MQTMGAQNTRLPSCLAHETTIIGLLLAGEEREKKGDSHGVTAPEGRLEMRPDIMIVGHTTDDL